MREVDFQPVKPTLFIKCVICYSRASGLFIRAGRTPFPACRDHYPLGMRALVRHKRWVNTL